MPNIKQIPITEILNYKQEKDERRTSNAQHRTPRAYPNSTLEVRCSMLDVRFLLRFWSLDIGIYLEFGVWNLGFPVFRERIRYFFMPLKGGIVYERSLLFCSYLKDHMDICHAPDCPHFHALAPF